jgi:hypothetical protein
MRRALHPRLSPDLASSDFYRFGKVKTALMGVFGDENKIFHGVGDVLSGISPNGLEAVSANWVARLETCMQRG